MAFDTSTTNPRPVRPATTADAPPAGRAGRPGRARPTGFTLVEAMIASSILAVAVIAIGSSLTASTRQTAVVREDSTALLLARQLMEEIAAKPFVDPVTKVVTTNAAAAVNAAAAQAAAGPGAPARATFDNVGEYHGYTDIIDTSKPIVSLKGKKADVTFGRTYTRTVTVEFRATPGGAAATTGDFALVSVTVATSGGRSVSIARLATNATLMQADPYGS